MRSGPPGVVSSHVFYGASEDRGTKYISKCSAGWRNGRGITMWDLKKGEEGGGTENDCEGCCRFFKLFDRKNKKNIGIFCVHTDKKRIHCQ
jgi:hypothetical protein